MILAIIAACDKNRVIGHGGSLPWDIPADMQYFREMTRGKPVIMGRKTHESIGRALPKRLNIVVTRQSDYQPAEGCTVALSLEEAIQLGKQAAAETGADEIMLIGGGQLYRQALPLAERIYLTQVEAEFPGDTYFPELAPDEWQLVSERTEQDSTTAGFVLHFRSYTRKRLKN